MPDATATTLDLDVMIIEAGIMANSLTPTDAGKALTAKIQEASDAAWAEQKPDVVLSVTPFEAGMLLGGLSRSSGQVSGDLINRVFGAVNAMMRSLNIQPLPQSPPSLDGAQAPAAGMIPPPLDGSDETPSSESTPTDSSAASGADAPSESPAPEATEDSSETPTQSAPSTPSDSES